MAIIILLACVISVFLGIGMLASSTTNKKEILIIAAISFFAVLVVITEFLSALHQLTFSGIFVVWSVVLFATLLLLYFKKSNTVIFIKSCRQSLRKALTGLTGFEKFLLFFTAAILLLTFIQGILYPPNNWDSMTYHMARIASWISHRSLAHYPTHIIRQLYQPPFAEYVIMHVDVLNRTDYFSNSVQFIFLLLSIISILLIIEDFGLSRKYKIIAIVLAVTIPEVILQAASTQNDVVVSFFIITSWYFSLKTISDGQLKYFVALGITIGLCLLTKGTAYVYLFPILLLWGIRVLIGLFKTKNYSYLWFSLLVVLIFTGLNAGHYYRNYKLTHNVLGVDKQESKTYSNQKMNPEILLLAIVKNAGLHAGFMFVNATANFADKAIYKLHALTGADINDPALNYRNSIYTTKNGTTDEDNAPNLLHFVFILATLVILIVALKKEQPFAVNALLIIIIVQIILFCLYLKWQPWNSRLHTPVFLLSIPLIVYALSINYKFSRIFYFVAPVMLAYAFMVVLHNSKRPYAGANFYPRSQKYFIGKPADYEAYNAINQNIRQAHYKDIGLMVREDDWVYPFFSDCFSKEIHPVYIGINNLSKVLSTGADSVDCIISTTTTNPFIDYNGKRFYKQQGAGNTISLYK